MPPSWLAPAVLLAFFVTLVVIFWRARKRKHDDVMRAFIQTSAGFSQAMADLAEKAVADAKAEFGLTLDYTPESLERVEELLGRLHEQHLKTPLSGRELNRRALRFGVYVGEVIRRQFQGEWEVVTAEDYDPMAFQITHKDERGREGTSFTVNWCGKRILNGPEDNIWHKYLITSQGHYTREQTQSTAPAD